MRLREFVFVCWGCCRILFSEPLFAQYRCIFHPLEEGLAIKTLVPRPSSLAKVCWYAM